MPTIELDLETRKKQGKDALDAWTREMVQWHFDPATGCPFWLNWAEKAGWDPRREIHVYEDLDRFATLRMNGCAAGPLQKWVPKGLAGKPVYTFETGGSTGVPSRASRLRTSASTTRCSAYAPRLGRFLWRRLAACGSHRPAPVRLSVEHLCQYRGGICFMVDLDPRWVIKLISAAKCR